MKKMIFALIATCNLMSFAAIADECSYSLSFSNNDVRVDRIDGNTGTSIVTTCTFDRTRSHELDQVNVLWIYRCVDGASFQVQVEKGTIYNEYSNALYNAGRSNAEVCQKK